MTRLCDCSFLAFICCRKLYVDFDAFLLIFIVSAVTKTLLPSGICQARKVQSRKFSCDFKLKPWMKMRKCDTKVLILIVEETETGLRKLFNENRVKYFIRFNHQDFIYIEAHSKSRGMFFFVKWGCSQKSLIRAWRSFTSKINQKTSFVGNPRRKFKTFKI